MASSNQQPARLTKKQKKATAFRERGSGKPKGKGQGTMIGKPKPTPGHSRRALATAGDNGEDGYDDEDDEDANAVPVMEDQDQALAAMTGYTEGDAKGEDSVQNPRAVRVPKKSAMESTSTSTATQNKRKKRGSSSSRAEERKDSDSDSEAQPGPKKKARLTRSSKEILPAREEDGATSMNDGGDGSKTKSKGSKPLRYILFIGNLKYTTTREAIQKHFVLCDPPPTVRLLTPKVTRAGVTAVAKSKSKGCAFLEFSTRHALQAALRLHQSELDGRRINVELTAGGGGKSDARLAKVKSRNKHLGEQRTRRLKEVMTQGKDATQHEHRQPQRFSTTSGESEVPRAKRTWTIGDGDQGGEPHGRTKAGKKRGTRLKNWGTGVNALPIG